MRDVQWMTQNCLMTFDTIGIWPETVDGTDLVVGARSWSGSDFVAGDDGFCVDDVKGCILPMEWVRDARRAEMGGSKDRKKRM